jgi:oligopeptidase A
LLGKKILRDISAQYQTGEPLPDELYKKMRAAKNFQTGMMMVRQLEFALFDFRLHLEYKPGGDHQVQLILNDVRRDASVIPVPEFNRFQHGFSHIFGGGYAGYYSYKWAEVLSADAYSAFEDNGLYSRDVGLKFMENILEVGGVRDPMDTLLKSRYYYTE